MYKNKYLISVIMPVFNVEKYLSTSIESILKQQYDNFELILVDDGSTDNSGNICDQYMALDRRIKVIHKDNSGLSDARNVGLSCARGDYITYVDSDDSVSDKYLLVMINNISKYDADIVQVDYTKDITAIDTINKEKVVLESSEEILLDLLYLKNFKEAACGKLYTREVAEKVPFLVGRLYEDVLSAYQFAFYSERFVACHTNLYYYRVNQEGIMHKPLKAERFTVLSVYDEMSSFFADHSEECINKRIDISRLELAKLYYEFRTKIYIYNEALGKNGDNEFPEEMESIRKDLISNKYSSIQLEIKYKILRKMLRLCPATYKRIALKTRSFST